MSRRKILHYEYLWPGEDFPRQYSARYGSLDFAAGRPIHKDMSVAPPYATAVYDRPAWWQRWFR
jgi:hypothetical protein